MTTLTHILVTLGIIVAIITLANLAVFGPLVYNSWRKGDFR